MSAIAPGATIGILGSGQLGRMLALAAGRLGLKCHIFADASGPAFDVAAFHTVADYADVDALRAFAASVAAATFEFENIPVATVDILSGLVPVRPGAKALSVTQDRLAEKILARRLGAATADFAAIGSWQELADHLTSTPGLLAHGPAILKTRRLGYDGKGQVKVASAADAGAAWEAIGGQPAILEAFVPFEAEASVIGARDVGGRFTAYDLVRNSHRNHILDVSTVPSGFCEEIEREAVAVTRAIADELDYVGVLGVEFFVLGSSPEDSGRKRLVVNEIAPRVHNSGHWTIDACAASQFENHIRAVAGWPLGSTQRHSDAVMRNLIGADHGTWSAIAADPGVCLHLYGKGEARAGRKMGHITRLAPRDSRLPG